MTVAELRDVLSSFPQNACVFAGTMEKVRKEEYLGVCAVVQVPRGDADSLDGVSARRGSDGIIRVSEGCCYIVLDEKYQAHHECVGLAREIGKRRKE